MKPLPLFAAAEEMLGGIVLTGIVLWMAVLAYRKWVPENPPATDTTGSGDEVNVTVEETGLEEPLCLHCLTPHGPTAYFCPHCNAAVGPYNNLMPYLQIYSEAQWLRSAGAPPPRNPLFLWTGYALLSLALLGPLAPIVWIVWSVMRRPATPALPRA